VVAGSNTSTVTLRVVGGDEKGSLKTETSLLLLLLFMLLALASSINKRQTHPLVRVGAPQK
jgi:hypothetical protein